MAKWYSNIQRLLPDWSLNILLVVSSIGLTCVAIEIALRLFLPPYPHQGIQHRIPDPELGWVLRPNANYQRVMLEGNVPVAYNSRGWRDIEHQVDKHEGIFRILILGDSFMEAYTVPLDDAFSRQLEALAVEAGYKVEVINLGVGGYGTLQQTLAFQHYGQQYDPDLVLLAFYTMNDVSDNSMELREVGKRPFLDVTSDGWRIVPVDFARIQSDYQRTEKNLKRNSSMRLNQLRIAQLFNQLEHTRLLSNKREARLQSLLDHTIRGSTTQAVNKCVEAPEYTRAWAITERVLAKLKTDVAEAGASFVVFNVPAIIEVDLDYQERALSYATHPHEYCFEEAPGHARLFDILNQLDVAHVDLLSVFRRAHRVNGLQLYPPDDVHWNNDGHALAAEHVLNELIALDLMGAMEK